MLAYFFAIFHFPRNQRRHLSACSRLCINEQMTTCNNMFPMLDKTSWLNVLSKLDSTLLYPKICPPIFFKKLPNQAAKFPKGCTVKGLLYSQDQGLCSDQGVEVSKGLIKSHMPTNMVKHPHIKFQYIQHKIAQSKP